jgi:MoaA/NifB/PqqE/SkfB family radical SAM enzyme
MFSSKDELLGAAEKLLSFNRPEYQITLYGGEPTYHPHFLDLLNYFAESKSPILLRMFTNGSRSPTFFEKMFETSKDTPFGIIFSLHLEHARFDNFRQVVEIAAIAGKAVGVSLMFHPKFRVQAKEYVDELLALHKKTPFFMNIVTPYTPDGIMGEGCTVEDYVWMKESREAFDRIPIPKHLQSPFFTRIRSNITIERKGKLINLAPEESLQLLGKSEMPSYQNFYCCGGTNVIFIAENGTVSGGVCEAAEPLYNIFHESLPSIISKMNVVQCSAKACNSIENIPLPKFRKLEDADACIAAFKERAAVYYDRKKQSLTAINCCNVKTHSKLSNKIKYRISQLKYRVMQLKW